MQQVRFLDQTFTPSKIICVGRNYVEHIEELGNEIQNNVVYFMKPNSAISEKLHLPPKKCRYEAELSFLVIDKQYAAVAFGIDLTLVDVQERLKLHRLPWEEAKAFDRSAVFSEFVPFSNIDNLKIELHLNGQLRQQGDSSLMIYHPLYLLEDIQKHFTLEDGDIVMTGTPKGVGILQKNDLIDGIILEKNIPLITWQGIATP